MANFPTKTTGSQVLTPGDKQLLQWTQSNSPTASVSTITYKDDEDTVLLYNADYAYDNSFYKKDITFVADASVVRRGYYFDGTGDYLSIPDHADWDFGDGDFTVEMFVRFASLTGQQTFLSLHGATSGDREIYWTKQSGGNMFCYYYYGAGSNTTALDQTWGPSVDTWYHIAMCRNGANLRFFVDGTQLGSTHDISTRVLQDSGYALQLGSLINTGGSQASYLNGYIADIVISKGVARYTGSFDDIINIRYSETPKDSYHKLILTGSATDGSDSGHAITFAGGANPTIPSGSWDRDSLHQGSFYFGGDDWLIVGPSSDLTLGSGDFTVEFWALNNNVTGGGSEPNSQLGYLQISTGTNGFETTYVNNLQIRSGDGAGDDGMICVNINDSWIKGSAGDLTSGMWHHIAVARSGSSSNNVKVYIDGVKKAEGTNTSTLDGTYMAVGGYYSTNYTLRDGHMTDIRISKGVARYTGAFTPPTASLEAEDPRTKLLLNTNSMLHDFNLKRFVDSTGSFGGDAKIVRRGYSLDGTGDYLSVPDSSDWNFGSGDWTIEFWAYWNSLSGNSGFMGQDHGGAAEQGWYFYNHNSGIIDDGFIFRWRNTAGDRVGQEWSEAELGLVAEQWYHVALVRDGAALTLFLDGEEKAIRVVEVAIAATTLRDADGTLTIGRDPNAAEFNGYMSDIRLIKGDAVYSGSFTPPMSLTASANTKLLLTGSTKDSSAEDHSITFNGHVTTTAKVGDGAFYFDGTGDSITVSGSSDSSDLDFAAADFTIEFWMNASTVSNDMVASHGSRWQFYFGSGGDAGKMAMYCSSDGSNYDIISDTDFFGTSFAANRWYHIAFTREGSSWKGFRDGVLMTTLSSAATMGTASLGAKDIFLGDHYNGLYPFAGHIDEFRISKGIARYTGSFDTGSLGLESAHAITKPITTLSTIGGNILVLKPVAGKSFYETDKVKSEANTVLHISPRVGDSEVIKDISMYNNSITTSGPVITSSMTVSGAVGIYFDGSDDYLSIPHHDNFDFGSGDFTVECWYNPLASLSDSYIMSINWASGGSNLAQCTLEAINYYGADKMRVAAGATDDGGAQWTAYNSSDLDLNTWHHIAAVKSGDVLTCYVDGVANGSPQTMSGDLVNSGTGLYIGKRDVGTHANCYLADIRIIKGTALYTSTFTPPSRQETVEVDKPSAMALHNFHPGGAVTFHHGTEEPSTPSANNYVLYQDTPDDQNTVLLLHMDGENTGTVLRDVSRTGTTGSHFITLAGTAQTSTAQSKFGGSSLLIDGNSDFLSIPYSVDFDFGSGDYTVECWYYPLTSVADSYIMSINWASGGSNLAQVTLEGSNYLNVGKMRVAAGATDSGGGQFTDYSDPFELNTWHHIAAVKNGNVLTCYVDGVANTGPQTMSGDLVNSGTGLYIGKRDVGTYTHAYIDEVRITKGIARYSGSFTPPTQPFGGGLRMKDPDGKIYALSLSGSA